MRLDIYICLMLTDLTSLFHLMTLHTAFSHTMTAEEIVRVKQLRRREKSKSYSQKYRDVNAKGMLVWPTYAAEQGAEQGQCQALPVAGLG